MIKIYLFVSSMITFLQFMYSQDINQSSGQEVIESILSNASDDMDFQKYGEELEYYRDHPLNIAKPLYSELIRLPFVSPLLAESIILFTDSIEVTSVDQIISVSLMTPVLFEQLLPFIIVSNTAHDVNSFSLVPSRMISRTRLERRLQITDGFRNNKYLGDANVSYQRIKIGNRNIEMAGLVEKDVGERYSNGFLAGYVSIKNIPLMKQLIIGNYNVSAGQGLVLSKNISTSKGSDAIGQIQKRGNPITPSVSTDEYRYYSGTTAQFKYQSFQLTGFYSDRKLPASLDSNGVATSFYTSGIYQTENDLQRRNVFSEKVVGGKVDFSLDESKTISFNIVNVEYNNYLKPTVFDLSGKQSISAGSVSWEIPVDGIITFGETASNDGYRFSKVFGIIYPITKYVGLSYHHRAYTKGFTSPLARPFGERDNIGDGELGNYLGMEIQNENMLINSYVDQYTLPSTTIGFSATGRDLLLNIRQSISKQLSFTYQIRNKQKSQIEIRNMDDERFQTNYRFAYTFKATSQLSLCQRFEFVKSTYNPSKYSEEGFLSFVEVIYRNLQKRMMLKSRCIIFKTDSYDSRLYQYESDVAGNFSNPPIYGKGIRWYVVAGFEFLDKFHFSCKYSETKKLDEIVLGSGDDKIQGNVDNQFALQLDLEF